MNANVVIIEVGRILYHTYYVQSVNACIQQHLGRIDGNRNCGWKNVDGNLSSYEQFKLDKLCRIEMARYVEQIEFSGVLSVCL